MNLSFFFVVVALRKGLQWSKIVILVYECMTDVKWKYGESVGSSVSGQLETLNLIKLSLSLTHTLVFVVFPFMHELDVNYFVLFKHQTYNFIFMCSHLFDFICLFSFVFIFILVFSFFGEYKMIYDFFFDVFLFCWKVLCLFGYWSVKKRKIKLITCGDKFCGLRN